MPASFIRSILDAREKGQYHGLGFFHFYWQQAENPALLARLNLPGPARGVVVIEVPDRPDGGPKVLRPNDIILQIDGFDLDVQGDYHDPEYGYVMLENLSTRSKWAGDEVNMKIWRNDKELAITYRLPKYAYTNSLVPFATYDQEPQYLIVGGLLFEPLTDPYLQGWGADWRRRAPLRLLHYRDLYPTKERPSLVVLSQVLPDAYNLGYEDQSYLVVDTVDGQRISTLRHLRQALLEPAHGYHVIEFMQSNSLRRMVVASGEAEQAATDRVLKRYGITAAYFFDGPSEN
jgi:PDZ domain